MYQSSRQRGEDEGRTGGEEADCFETVDSIFEESGNDDVVRRELPEIIQDQYARDWDEGRRTRRQP